MRHRITLLGTRNPDPHAGRAAVEHLRDHGIEAIEVEHVVPPKSGVRFYARLAANLASPLPYSVVSHTGPALDSAVRHLAVRVISTSGKPSGPAALSRWRCPPRRRW